MLVLLLLRLRQYLLCSVIDVTSSWTKDNWLACNCHYHNSIASTCPLAFEKIWKESSQRFAWLWNSQSLVVGDFFNNLWIKVRADSAASFASWMTQIFRINRFFLWFSDFPCLKKWLNWFFGIFCIFWPIFWQSPKEATNIDVFFCYV